MEEGINSLVFGLRRWRLAGYTTKALSSSGVQTLELSLSRYRNYVLYDSSPF